MTVLISRVLFIVVFIAVTVLSVVTVPQQAHLESDKTEHLLAYTALALFGGFSVRRARGMVLVLAGLVVYGAAIEVIQSFIGRDMNALDIVANCAGVAVGSGIAVAARRLASRFGVYSGDH